MGREFECDVGASPDYVRKELRDWGEWLYDVHWLAYDEDRWLNRMALAAESEWGDLDAIGSDFEELLVARATVRVMVYEGRKKDGGTVGVANRLAEYVGEFQGNRGTRTC